jgi:D-proline reductase (dithiol) PrdB
MADFSELPLRYRLQMATYRWRRLEPVPWAPPSEPLERARIALVTSAGLYRAGTDEPFAEMKGGDPSFRLIPGDVAPQQLTIGQTSDAFDRAPLERQKNAVYPLDALERMVADGELGCIAPRHLSFNGSITAPGRLIARTAPAAAEALRADAVHLALLVPV